MKQPITAVLVWCALLSGACGGGDGPSGPPQPGPPAQIAVSGSGQSGSAGSALPSPLVVTVTDAQGRAVPGAAVTWQTADGTIAPASGTTNASGQAQAMWTLAPKLGEQSATATAAGSLSASFTATATLPTTTTLLRVAGDAQSDTVAATLRDTLVVQLRLPSGEGLAGIPVTWAVAQGGGTVVPLAPSTDATGRARAVWTLGTTVVENRVTASSSQLAPVTFTATARAGSAHAITVTPDSLLLDAWADTARFAAVVRDRFGNTATGAVSWSSNDTTIARVSSTGLVTTQRPGRALITASAGGVTTVRAVNVPLQRNAACRVPTPVTRGAVGALPSFGPDVIFLGQQGIAARAYAGARAFALDFDGDGDEDVIRLDYSYPGSNPYTGETRVFLNENGTLRDATTELLAAPIVPDHPRDFEIADFNGDGRPDVYVAQHGFDAEPFPGAPNLLLTFQGGRIVNRAPTAFVPYSTTGFTHGSATADVDCDGDLDIVELSLLSTTSNMLLLNNGAGSFSAAPASAFPITALGQMTAQRWQETAVIDFDADGDPDIFLGARSGAGWNEDALLVNDGFGRFRFSSAIRLPAPRYTSAHAINSAKAADFDGDGREDLVLFEIPEPFSTRSAIRLWRNMGDGSFTDVSQAWGLPAECSGEVIEPLRVLDMNRDGWPDIVLPFGCPEAGGAGLLINRGNRFDVIAFGSFVSWLAHDVATPIDIDRDGYLDLLFAERGGDVVLVRNRR